MRRPAGRRTSAHADRPFFVRPRSASSSVPTGDSDQAGAEHLARVLAERWLDQMGASPVVCTHAVRAARRHYAVSLEYPGVGPGGLDCDSSVVLCAAGAGSPVASSGAAAWGEGAAAAMAAHRDRSAGRAVRFPGDGQVLLVRSAGADEVGPFEIANPHECCGGAQ